MLKFVFDLDGTITSAETLPIIARHFDIHEELMQLTKDTVDGKIPWKKSFVHRVHLLRDVPVDQINALLIDTPLYPKIEEFIKKNLEHCYVATGNLDCWVNGLCSRIGCRYYSSRAQIKDGKIHKISSILEKADVVQNLQDSGYKVVFVGDSNNDVNAMRKADISIAYGASHQPSRFCLSAADHVDYSEEDLIRRLVDIREKYAL